MGNTNGPQSVSGPRPLLGDRLDPSTPHDPPIDLYREQETRFRLHQADTSPMSCQTVLCRLEHHAA